MKNENKVLWLILVITILVFLFAGCKTIPVKRTFHDVPEPLIVMCEDLQLVPDNPQLSDVVTVVMQNYSSHHQCRAKHESWIQWYNEQKDIYESVNED